MNMSNPHTRDIFAIRNGIDRIRVLLQSAMEKDDLVEVKGDLQRVLTEAEEILSGKVEHRPNLNGGGFDSVIKRAAQPTRGK